MFTLRSTLENVAEKVFGRLLPQVEARAFCGNCQEIPQGCCGPGGSKWALLYTCYDSMGVICYTEYRCKAICPT